MEDNYKQEYFNEISEKQDDVLVKYLEFMSKNSVDFQNKTIGDFGCAKGLFLKKVENNICYGFDVSRYAINECQLNNPDIKDNFRVFDLNSDMLSINIKFDIITLFDVVEHLDSFSNLKNIINVNLKDGGFVVITTPNANSFLRFILGSKKYTGEIDKTHTNLFTPYTLDFFLRRSGLKKVTLSTPYSFYFKDDLITRTIKFGGQIFAIYKKYKIL